VQLAAGVLRDSSCCFATVASIMSSGIHSMSAAANAVVAAGGYCCCRVVAG
jgi:hypothetical protein